MLLHGFTDTWRTWELVLPALERRHEVLAVTLPGHAGGPDLPDELHDDVLADAVCVAMDEAGWETAHVAGNSLGGFVALQVAARERARSVVAFAPAGGWALGDNETRGALTHFVQMRELAQAAAPHADAIVATPEGRRRASSWVAVNYEHIPGELLAHQIRGVGAAPGTLEMVEHARRAGWPITPDRVSCPLRFVWGAEDRLLPWPDAAEAYRSAFPTADWVVLDEVGHSPQLDVPLEAAQLILGFTSP